MKIKGNKPKGKFVTKKLDRKKCEKKTNIAVIRTQFQVAILTAVPFFSPLVEWNVPVLVVLINLPQKLVAIHRY